MGLGLLIELSAIWYWPALSSSVSLPFSEADEVTKEGFAATFSRIWKLSKRTRDEPGADSDGATLYTRAISPTTVDLMTDPDVIHVLTVSMMDAFKPGFCSSGCVGRVATLGAVWEE